MIYDKTNSTFKFKDIKFPFITEVEFFKLKILLK
jgi:hypothetical protein